MCIQKDGPLFVDLLGQAKDVDGRNTLVVTIAVRVSSFLEAVGNAWLNAVCDQGVFVHHASQLYRRH